MEDFLKTTNPPKMEVKKRKVLTNNVHDKELNKC